MKKFEEVQRINWKKIFSVVGLVILIFILALFLFTDSFNSESILGVLISYFLAAALIFLISRMVVLKTYFDKDKVHVKYLPFVNKSFFWKDIEKAELIKYRFVGYGIRFSFKYNLVYNASGNIGLLLYFKNGKKRLIGTQKGTALFSFLQKNANLSIENKVL